VGDVESQVKFTVVFVYLTDMLYTQYVERKLFRVIFDFYYFLGPVGPPGPPGEIGLPGLRVSLKIV